jgi:outer membrane receptor protein involved in Fe transport
MQFRALFFAFFSIVVASLASAQTTSTTTDQQSSGSTQSTQQQKIPPVQQTIEVTATRIPEDPENVPTAIEIFSGEELGARGIRDLRDVLGTATGMSIAPGGDNGPASNVPQFWGLQEPDAYLLVVDGVPWGGAFNPATTALNLSDVDRVEVLRGPAPVMYGATSFVGVIQVVHKDAAAQSRTLDLWGGSFATGGGSFSSSLPMGQNWSARFTAEAERESFSSQRTSYVRGHGVLSLQHKSGANSDNYEWFTADVNWLNQDPVTPRPRVGTTLSPDVPVDSNQNMAGAFFNDHRPSFYGGFQREFGNEKLWSTTVNVSPDRQQILHGFLTAVEDIPDNARGVRENIQLNDIYADTHISFKPGSPVRLIFGADYNFGLAHAQGADFEYTAPLSGRPAPIVELPEDLDFHINDTRNFFGAYSALEWTPAERVRVDGGIRLNVTNEYQQVIDGGAGTQDHQTRTDVKPGANLGIIVTPWRSNRNSLGLFANYRYTYKPAAIDFGIGEEEEGGGGDLILKPETSWSVQGGLKGRLLDGRMQMELSGFYMRFNNLVSFTNVDGVPELINAGKQRFTGFESSVLGYLPHNFQARATYSYHNDRFVDFAQEFDGVLTQLAGKRIEMSPLNIAGVGLFYVPVRGLFGNLQMIYTGSRYLDKRNRSLADGFASLEIGVGYRTPRWELVVSGRNLTDARDPVSESEQGDAQYYLLPARKVQAALRIHF